MSKGRLGFISIGADFGTIQYYWYYFNIFSGEARCNEAGAKRAVCQKTPRVHEEIN